MASFFKPLAWPEDEKVALRFILDHAQGLAQVVKNLMTDARDA
jgi:hypothetical protein